MSKVSSDLDVVSDSSQLLRDHFDLVTPFSNPLRPEDWGPKQRIPRRIAGAIHAAGIALRSRDYEEVVKILDDRIVHETMEAQSLGRLAEAYMLSCVVDPFRKAVALAAFCTVYNYLYNSPKLRERLSYKHACNASIVQTAWSKERLKDVSKRAELWLDEYSRQM